MAQRGQKAGWQNRLLAAAQPVSASTGPFRSDQLIGTDVVTPHNESLGTVDDIVVSPRSGKVTYLVEQSRKVDDYWKAHLSQ
jgi:hypothetical protein